MNYDNISTDEIFNAGNPTRMAQWKRRKLNSNNKIVRLEFNCRNYQRRASFAQ